MNPETGKSGIFTVSFDPGMPGRDFDGYNQFVRKISEMPLASRYRLMASRIFTCLIAVNSWKQLQSRMPEYQFDDQWFKFNQKVKDHFGYEEKAQDMLRVQIPGSNNVLVADVAGYRFGFSYEEMLVAAGSLDYVAGQVTNHYSKRYPGLIIKAYGQG